MADLSELCDDLEAEYASIDELLAPLTGDDWRLASPSPGWTLRDQVAHLYFGDNRARLTMVDPDAFVALRDAEKQDAGLLVRNMVGPELGADGDHAYATWKSERAGLLTAYRTADPKVRVQWYGPSMSPASKVTARIMETWAHGVDIADALGVQRRPTNRLRHVAHLGVGARAFSYLAHGLEPPTEPVFVELRGPDGDLWTWGDPNAENSVRGSALDFCLLITQRRHVDDTDLTMVGPVAKQWISIGQAFAGPPGAGRRPGQFAAANQRTATDRTATDRAVSEHKATDRAASEHKAGDSTATDRAVSENKATDSAVSEHKAGDSTATDRAATDSTAKDHRSSNTEDS